jgi:hypothetical protein
MVDTTDNSASNSKSEHEATTDQTPQDSDTAATQPSSGADSADASVSDTKPDAEATPVAVVDKPASLSDEPVKTEADIIKGDAASDEPETDEESKTEAKTEKQAEAKAEDTKTDSKPESKPKAKKKEVDTTPVTAEDLTAIEGAIAKLSIKNTAELFTVRNQLNRLRKRLAEDDALSPQAETLHESIFKLVEENQTHQEELQTLTAELLGKLEKALEEGQSHDALPTWDRIQGNISNTSGQIRNALQELVTPFKSKIDELRDWKIFAATEKKRELITQMEQLCEQSLSPQDLNKRISKLHAEWKSLGRSNDNETLWKQFKTFSDKAYAPCKEFFKQRKSVMAENLKKRRALCDMLEKELAEIDPDNVHVGNINKLLSNTEAEWKSHAPVEQSKIKSLQKRYYDLVNQFRKLRKSSARQNGAEKQALIDEANELVTAEDRRQAIEKAKQLQKQWKEIGPTSFKEDKKYWADFRAACDKIFEQRSQQTAQRKAQSQAAEHELKSLLTELETFLAFSDSQLRDAKSQFHTLAQKFNATITGKLRQTRSKQIEKFNEIKRKIDNRFQALPDEKTQVLFTALEQLDTQLSACEDKLLACQSDAEFLAVDKSVEDSLFECQATLPDAELKTLLEKRKQANNSSSLAAFKKLTDENDAVLRKLCVETEIRAGADSPSEDQSLRMELQLAQLQDGFGQSRPSNKENIAYARRVRLQVYCLGPVSTANRTALRSRIEAALNRLL